ncbi:MAG: phage tail protein [Oscillospiraceae bacterium]|nr:phage tail protein [Oscillospiraceae bacterium]
MRPILYPAGETAFSTEGLGRLTDAIECAVTEELNGAYELALKYDRGGIHAGEIAEGTIICAAHDDGGGAQPFRVYRVAETLDGEIGVLARHISGDLSRIPVLPFTAASAAAALAGLGSHAAVTCPFTFRTDVTAAGAFGLEVPTSAKAALGAGDGSIIGVFGGEVEYDKRTVILRQHRGEDNGVRIRYGKNLTGLEAVSESGTYNAVVPFCKTQDGVVMCDPPVVYHGASYADAVPLDLSDKCDYVPSPAQLELAALEWLSDNQPWIAEKSITVNFVALWQTEEYRDYAPLERVMLGDTVRVEYPEIGVDAQFRVVRTVYDPLEERYAEVTLGREERTVSGMMAELTRKLAEARDIAQEIANGTYRGGTFINGSLIYAPSIYGGEISIGERTGGGYNFGVDSSGNLTTHGSVHLKGADTQIVAPKIFANSLSVYPEGLDEAEVPASPSPGFNLYNILDEVLYRFLRIYQYAEYTHFASDAGGYAAWDFNLTEVYGGLNLRGRAKYYRPSGTQTSDELATIGDIPDVSGFVTADQVQDMIDAALE